jgi:hypothetical protein
MSVEPTHATSAYWARWQGHVINDLFPLARYLGGSDHSGVFLTQCAAHFPSQVAVKLIPTTQIAAQARLTRWKKLSALTHPHLLGLFECGGCHLDGSLYLYVVMEYAEQTLAQLLQRRAQTDAEAREMLLPILDALAVLHGQNLVHGGLKPSNILVVGEQLKLASDTIHRVGESIVGSGAPTIYDPPEARHGGASTAGDMWALGVSLSEALALRPPQGLGGSLKAATLPADFSPAFRKIVARSLSTSPQKRPNVAEFMAWLGGQTVASAPAAAHTPAAPKSKPKVHEPTPLTTQRPQVASEAKPALPVRTQPLKPLVLPAAVLGALVVFVLVWTTVRALISHRAPTHVVPTPAVAEVKLPAPSVSTSAPAVPPVALHEALPDVPQGVLESIRGHINIGVRVIVEPGGSVFAALEDRTSASKRLQRLAIDAAKEWAFPPAVTPSRRLMQIQFDFSRDGTTATARALD